MPRTTVDLDPSVLRDLKRRAKVEGKSLGTLISQILAPVLTEGSQPRVRSKIPLARRADGAAEG